MKTIQFPLIRITLTFISGIILENNVRVNPIVLYVGILITAVSLSALYFHTRKRIRPQPWFGVFTFFFFMLLGMVTTQVHNQLHQSSHFTNHFKKSQAVKVIFQVESALRSTARNHRFVGTIQSINDKSLSGKVVVTLSKKENKPQVGLTYASWAWLKLNNTPPNPGQFDYSNYLVNKHIFGQLYVKKIKSIPQKNSSIRFFASAIQNQIAKNLENHLGKNERPLVMALLLGQQNDIASEINSDYQKAGAIHILSVSGLHVGFLVILLQFIFRLLPNTSPFRRLKLLVTLVVLWSFGCIAGLAPSVLRSVTMFSFVAIGHHLRRTVNIYNTLCIAAFLILLCEPNYLWDVGFQLSYCALFFIVWLQPLIQQLWEPKYKVMRYFWNLTTVSIAAQLGTLPLSFYYFHQFPGLFLVSNWLILPPLGLLLLLGFLLCIFAYANVFWEPLTNAVQWSVEQMNGVIHWVAQHEKFVIQDIPMQLPFVILLYAFVFSVVHFIQKRNYPNFCWLVVLLLGLQCNWMVIQYRNSEEELVVYNLRKRHFITWKHNREIDTLGNNSSFEKPLDNYRLANTFTPKVIRKSPIQRLYCNGQKIVVIDKKGVFPIQPVDYIVLIQNPKCHLHYWLETHAVKGVIADGSSSNSLKKLWKQSCKKLKIPFHDTSEKGPFML